MVDDLIIGGIIAFQGVTGLLFCEFRRLRQDLSGWRASVIMMRLQPVGNRSAEVVERGLRFGELIIIQQSGYTETIASNLFALFVYALEQAFLQRLQILRVIAQLGPVANEKLLFHHLVKITAVL